MTGQSNAIFALEGYCHDTILPQEVRTRKEIAVVIRLVLAAQASWPLPELIVALDRLLSETEADEWTGQVRWLNDWQ